MDNTLPLIAGDRIERLAELINQEPAALSTVSIATLTEYYQSDVIERVLRQVLPEYLDAAVSIISKRWQIDVDDHMAHVVRYDTELRTFVPYTEGLPAKLEEMKLRIVRRRQLEHELQQEQQALINLHNSSVTQTQSEPADVKNQTEAPLFAEGDHTPTEDVEYHMDDLPYDLRGIFCFNDDVNYTLFVKGMHKIKEWIKIHRKQDWNVVRFVCIVRCILAKRKTTLKLFAKLLQHIFSDIGDQENNMKHRKDANNEDNYERYDDPKKSQWSTCKQLKMDGSEVEDYFAPLIERLKGAA